MTPGAPAAARSTAGSISDQPSALVITAVAWTRRSSEPAETSLRPWAMTVTAVTSATPISSADAVTAVRPGWRIALLRASVPAEPPIAADGRPISPVRARTARPGSRTRAPASAASRSAATGATLVARRAGSMAATSVTSVPTSSAAATVPPESDIAAIGRPRPMLVNTLSSPAASARPAPIPTADAPRPIASASSSTVRRTWRRLAPTMRSSPSSRVRWATAIESALKIVNAPTTIATPAKASRIVRRMSTKSLRPPRS